MNPKPRLAPPSGQEISLTEMADFYGISVNDLERDIEGLDVPLDPSDHCHLTAESFWSGRPMDPDDVAQVGRCTHCSRLQEGYRPHAPSIFAEAHPLSRMARFIRELWEG